MIPRQRAEAFADKWRMEGEIRESMIADLTTMLQAESNAQLERQRAGHYGDVREFVEKFGQHRADKPGFPDQATMDFRVNLIAEEFCEFLMACGYGFELAVERGRSKFHTIMRQYEPPAGASVNFPKAIDGLLDLEYVILGTHCAFGVDPADPWARVHAANMSKEGGATRADGKVCKPHGFQPPDIEGALKAQGWQSDPQYLAAANRLAEAEVADAENNTQPR